MQESNQRGGDSLLGLSEQDITRRKFPFGLAPDSARAMEAAMSAVRSAGRVEALEVTAADGERAFDALVSLFRADGARLFLIRLTAHSEAARPGASGRGADHRPVPPRLRGHRAHRRGGADRMGQ